jgi:hypothetical protein
MIIKKDTGKMKLNYEIDITSRCKCGIFLTDRLLTIYAESLIFRS